MSVQNLRCSSTGKHGCRVILVRHPESESNQRLHEDHTVSDEVLIAYKDPPVTECKGVDQARCTAKHLYEKCVESAEFERVGVYTSIQRRVLSLTELFMGRYDDREITSLKDSSVKVDNPTRVTYTRTPDMYEYRRPGKGDLTVGEHLLREDWDWNAFVQRVKAFKKNVLEPAALQQDVIILFGHSVFFSLLMHLCTGSCPDYVDDVAFHFPNCSISQMVYNWCRWSVLCQGDVSHLSEHIRTGTHTSIYATPGMTTSDE